MMKPLDKKIIKNVWGWLDEICVTKTPISDIHPDSWEQFNAWTIHKSLSYNQNYVGIVNFIQQMNPQEKQYIYAAYREFIPKKKMWNKWIKSTIKPPNNELIELIAEYYNSSKREAIGYLDILEKDDLKIILGKLGQDEKQIKKLLKS